MALLVALIWVTSTEIFAPGIHECSAMFQEGHSDCQVHSLHVGVRGWWS